LNQLRLRWTLPALDDVAEIRDFIARDSAHYARLQVERIFSAVERLHEYPLAGRVVPELQQAIYRELLEGSYRAVYRVTADEVQILTVVHGAGSLPVRRVIEADE
jgi:toxin ParE1/3/4